MVRSIWKGVYIAKELKDYNNIKNNSIITKERSSVILPYLLGKLVYTYNGKNYVGTYITRKMLGRKLGEYSLTKKPAKFVKKNKK